MKEKAKWSSDPEEKKNAIKGLWTYGQNAVPSLQEILNVTAYDEIKMACIEAIRAISAEQDERRARDDVSVTITEANPSTTISKIDTKIQKKEEKEQESTGESELRLADLPP